MALTREQYEESFRDVLDAIRDIKPKWGVWSEEQQAYSEEPYPIEVKVRQDHLSGADIVFEFLGWDFQIWSIDHHAIPGLPDHPKDVMLWGINRIWPEQGCGQKCSVIASYETACSVSGLVEYLKSEFARTTDLVSDDH
jgi:hypothetical protein